ncbi:MAG: glycosyltransferase family 1 protein [Chloroflexota bacterium]
MRVGIIEDVLPSGTGIGEYGRRLLEGLRARGIPADRLFLPRPRVPFGDAVNHVIRLPLYLKGREGDYDIMHATSPITGLSFPLVRRTRVLTWHDLVSILCPNSGAAWHVKAFGPAFFRIIARSADVIIAVSTQTRQELVMHLGVPPDKVVVINEGIGEQFRPLPREKRDPRIIGYIGAFIARKRVDLLVRAFHHLVRKHPGLDVRMMIWGRKAYEYPRLAEMVEVLGLGGRVEFPGFVPEDKMAEVYNSFDVFAYASEWEGFGFPILEAQRCGIPVVMRREAHIPSEVSECCLKAESIEDMADKMLCLLTDAALREEVSARGLEYSRRFTWEKNVEDTVKVYETVMRR